jgi:hypothetical protein
VWGPPAMYSSFASVSPANKTRAVGLQDRHRVVVCLGEELAGRWQSDDDVRMTSALQLEGSRHRRVVWRHVFLPLCGIVPDGGQPVPEVDVAIRLGELPLAVFPDWEALHRGEDLVEQFGAPFVDAGEPPLLRDHPGEVEEAGDMMVDGVFPPEILAVVRPLGLSGLTSREESRRHPSLDLLGSGRLQGAGRFRCY